MPAAILSSHRPLDGPKRISKMGSGTWRNGLQLLRRRHIAMQGSAKIVDKKGRQLSEAEQLWEWREKIANLYHEVRSSPDVAAAWRLWCDTRATLFRTHPQSPIEPAEREAFTGPATFPYDPALRLTVHLAPTKLERITVAAGTDGDVSMHAFARTKGLEARLGGELTLYWIEGYGGGVFLPFTDATSGAETYGGGRYLLDTIKGADFGALRPDATLLLDFNFAYFPSCAYSPRYICPLSPIGNRLQGAIRAGERLPRAI